MLRERENELLNTTFEAQMDNSADMVSLMGAPMVNTATNSGTCLCAACCERKYVYFDLHCIVLQTSNLHDSLPL